MTPRDRCGQRGPAPSPRPTLRAFVEPVEHPDFAKLAKRFTRAMTPGSLEHLAAKLGLHARVLQSLGVGWVTAEELAELNTSCKTDGAWTFPMSDVVADKVVITGIRLRTVDGFKYAVAGSDGSGLFVPRNYRQYRGSMLLLPEGPTSCAALIQLGFYAVGRPNNRAGVSHLQRLARLLNPSRIVVVGDNDQKPDCTWPGLEGAEFIAGELQRYCKDVRILLPPDGVKDARKWLHGGARVVDVSNAIVTGQGVAA